MHPMLNIAIRAARSAGKLIVKALDHIDTLEITYKNKHDIATEIDQVAENEIIRTIKSIYRHHAILAEESGFQEGDEFVWIIDPLDGTLNFVRGYPHFSISIAIKNLQTNRIEHGIIYDPLLDELFTASRGRGAQLNSRRIRVAKSTQFNHAVIGISYPHHSSEKNIDHFTNTLKAFQGKIATYRRSGSSALDLAYVAAGRLDGCWEEGLSIWDIAAGTLMIKEAGGLVGDTDGSEQFLETGNVVAGNPKIFAELLRVIHTAK